MGMLIYLSVAFFAVAFAAPDMKLGKSMFEEFKLKHGRSYTSQVEHDLRFDIFMNSLKRVEKLNAKNGAKFGVTRFSDWTLQEKQNYVMSTKPVSHRPQFAKRQAPITGEVPESFDWRAKGIVTKVKDQGTTDCNSHWAFAAIAVVESMKAIQTGAKLDLSEQQLLDCDAQSGGCLGGYHSTALELVKSSGVVPEVNYPYTAVSGVCRNVSGTPVKINEVIYLPAYDDVATAEHIVNVGPVAAFLAVTEAFFDYVSGIWEPEALDCDWYMVGYQTVLEVGFGVENEKLFWILKNSWGTLWGEQGFFRMVRGIDLCQIESEVVGAK